MLDTPSPINLAASLDQPVSPAPSLPSPASSPKALTLRFTGNGREYFRIWIVNLLLTVVTLGIYSAWAKVRRLQYFDRNTELDGAVFDFTGSPMAILRGRLVALALLALYQYSIGFSLVAGIAVAVLLLAGMPFLVRGALRFRLAHTRYRGLRFHFTGSVADAYFAYLPLGALLLPVVLASRVPEAMVVVPLIYLLWPLMHCVMKRYQHGNVSFASLPSHIEMSRGAFYGPYLTLVGMFLLTIVLMTVVIFVGVIVGVAGAALTGGAGEVLKSIGAVGIIIVSLVAYGIMLAGGVYVMVRTTNRTWSSTTFPGLSFQSTMELPGYFKLQVVNVLLTLITLGLYHPFAAVRTYEYRLAHLKLMADDTLETAMASEAAHQTSASGDGVADFFDLDVSW